MANKTIDLNFDLATPDGSKIVEREGGSPLHCGKVLASMLMQNSSEDPLKTFDWASQLQREEVLELDESDFRKFVSIVKAIKMTDLLKANILLRCKE